MSGAPIDRPGAGHEPAVPHLSRWRLAAATFAGGLAGSAARALVQSACAAADLPTWAGRVGINVVGAFAAGWLFARLATRNAGGVPLGIPHVHRMREHGWSVGLLGGFTTVSGFAWDAAQAAGAGNIRGLALLLAANGVVGVAAAGLGWAVGSRHPGPAGAIPPGTVR